MTGQQLKNSILQMAVQGKLVPQDPNDEPASVLLERIRAEKEQLIKEGKIKKEKNPSIIFRGADNLPYEKVGKNEPVCIADEVPFDIPESWEWTRIGNVFQINPRNNLPDELETGFVPMALLSDGFCSRHSYEPKKWKDIKNGFTHFANNDIVIAKITPCFQNRKSAVVTGLPNGFGAGTTELHVLRDNTKELFMPYFLLICKTQAFIQDGVKNFSGTAGQQRIGKDFISKYLIPVPPVSEQERIVQRLHLLEPLLISYENAYDSIVNQQKNFPAQLKRSILQYAVQGKLVSQDPADEPAAILLEHIRAEKEHLIKAGKIKRDKHESVIFKRNNSYYEKVDGIERCIDDELPFEIPENWEWVRFFSIVEIATNLVSPERYFDYMHIAPDNIEKSTGTLLECRTVAQDKVSSPNHLFFKGQILYSKIRPLLRKAVIAPFDGLCSADMYPLKTPLNKEYLLRYILSDSFNAQVATAMSSRVKMPKINQAELSKVLIPVPPIQEQERIVNKIKELYMALV